MSASKLEAFREKIGAYLDVAATCSLLSWDQEVYMPPKGAARRGKQLATLSGIAHNMLTSSELGKLIATLEEQPGLAPDDASMVAEARYEYERARKLPAAFVTRLAQEESKAYEVWVEARRMNDFKRFQPNLETLLELLKQKADYYGYTDTPYDALLSDYERGMTTAQLGGIFEGLRARQSALVDRIVNHGTQPDLEWTKQTWDEQKQYAITVHVLEGMGFDFQAGRQDQSVHPFTTNFGLHDVRITTRFDPEDLFSALTGSIHEGGHALYEQGFREEDARTILAEAPSLGIHESQSRLWENMVGRSLPFWRCYARVYHEHFPGQLEGVAPEDFHRAINKVACSLIRVEADECTYNLHIILRFEIERALIEGAMKPADVPEAWNAKVKELLGLDVPTDTLGCLQDIHWSHGAMGYFPTYALGNLYAAQLFEKIRQELPDLDAKVEAGDFTPLLTWLREHVHTVGRRKLAPAIVRDATGQELSPEPFLDYLEQKYGALYGV
ncbi:MAG: carboxypeptidase M32 [Candidatus Hydrogenedentota bacterium]